MVALPPRMPLGLCDGSMNGADCTTPSSTIAAALHPVGGEQLGGCCSLTMRDVSLANWLVPPLLKLRSTCQSLPLMLCCGRFADAPLTWVPSTDVGASRYLVVPSRSQATR